MRHVEYPLIRHRVMVQVKHLLTSGATATHAVVGAVLLAMVQGIGGRRWIGWAHPPAVRQVPCAEDLRHRPLRPLPAKVCGRAVGGVCDRDWVTVAMCHACCSSASSGESEGVVLEAL